MKTVYLDASVIVALFVTDPFTDRASRWLQAERPALIVSDYAAAEFASALARLARMRDLAAADARAACAHFDEWVERAAVRTETAAVDVRTAERLLRRFDLTLRAPDALHIAAAQRLDARLATFDETMASCAKALGADVLVI